MYLGGNRGWVPLPLLHLRPLLPVLAIWSVTEVEKWSSTLLWVCRKGTICRWKVHETGTFSVEYGIKKEKGQASLVVLWLLNCTCIVARKVGSAITGKVKTSTKNLELSLARLICLVFLSIRNCFLCWFSYTSNGYFLIVCSIKCESHNAGKCNTNLSLLLCKHSIKMSQICINSKKFHLYYGNMVISLRHLRA